MAALWHTISPAQAAAELDSDPENGLTTVEAQVRLARYGPNKLPEPAAVSPWRLFLAQFKSVMTVLLLAATLIAFLLGDELEGIAILVVLLLNALLGFVNEYRAERSVQALKALVVPLAEVVRDGAAHEIPAAELVPGDIIAFEAGDRVPADARLIEARSLRLDESALTGESVATDKDSEAVLEDDVPLAERQTMVYTGTAIVQGRGQAIVTATAATTEIGKISTLMAGTEQEQTPLQERLDRLGRYLALAALVIAAVMVVVGLWRGQEFLSMLETSLALAIAAVPEGLPAVLTIALALGMRRMAQRRAIVRRLAAVETLGSTNVICTDKTGTLTQNQMTVRELHLGGRVVQVTGAGYEPTGKFYVDGQSVSLQPDPHFRLALQAGVLCNTASLERTDGRWEVVGDPTEGALLVMAAKSGLDFEAERDVYPKVGEIPFDARERRMVTIHRADPGLDGNRLIPDDPFVVLVKGAPEAVLPNCTRQQQGNSVTALTRTDWEQLWQVNEDMAGRALRVLALAYKGVQTQTEDPFCELVFLGLVGMIDPPRPEAKEAVQRCQEAGIRVVMITGDQKTTAQAIAQELGILVARTLESKEPEKLVTDGLSLDAMDEAVLQEQISETAVYARVSPEHKLRIVRAFQSRDQVVAMTGDGVNDAPALKAADIGVAMGRMGTDVAREAADMVLADDNFATIVSAVEQGRVVFANVRKFVHFLFSCNLSEILTMFVAAVVGLPLPLLPLQILWLNLVTDVFPALALAGEPAEAGMMQRPPPETRRQRPPATFVRSIAIEGALLAGATLLAFTWALGQSTDISRATTVAFLTLGLAQLFHVINSRFETGSALGPQLFTNRAVLGAIGLTVALQMAAVYLPIAQLVLKTVPPSLSEWGIVLIASLSPALVVEIYKVVRQ
jgi:Ca2+-transporting ATPase